MKRWLLRSRAVAAAALLLAQGVRAAAGESKKGAGEPFKRLIVDEAEKLLADPNVRVYDGNTDEVYLKGHLPGAVHLFSRDIKEGVLPGDKGTVLLFYCHNER